MAVGSREERKEGEGGSAADKCYAGGVRNALGRRRRRRSWKRGLAGPCPAADDAGARRMVHERRDGRLAGYTVPTPGVEAERSGRRLRDLHLEQIWRRPEASPPPATSSFPSVESRSGASSHSHSSPV
jgi:hypothetical protein